MDSEAKVSTEAKPQVETTKPGDWKINEPQTAWPRYEQSFPTSRPRATGVPGGGSTIAPTSIMDHTHDATTVDDAAQSTYSYDSTRDWTLFFKEINGRRFNNQSSTYILPAGKSLTMPVSGTYYIKMRLKRTMIDDVEFMRL
jgi:hypothetical protein